MTAWCRGPCLTEPPAVRRELDTRTRTDLHARETLYSHFQLDLTTGSASLVVTPGRPRLRLGGVDGRLLQQLAVLCTPGVGSQISRLPQLEACFPPLADPRDVRFRCDQRKVRLPA